MTTSVGDASAPVEVLAAGGDGVVVAAQNGNLFISGQKLPVKRVCGAAVAIADRILVAALTLEKEVVVLAKQHGTDLWKEVAKHLLPKRPTATALSLSTSQVIVADAFGDVFKLPINVSINLRGDDDLGSALLLGHFSTVTALALNASMIATADRDNKLRISRFPDSFVIQSFCLAHDDFITCLRWIGTDRLVSGAGDGTLRLWNTAEGQLLATVQIDAHISDNSNDINAAMKRPVVISVDICPRNADIAVVALYKASYVYIVSGLLSSAIRTYTALRFEEPECITGVGFDEKSRLWMSLSSDCSAIRRYSIIGLESLEPKLELEEVLKVGREDEAQPTEALGHRGPSVTRFDWLYQQRKREMVEDWKGKKRKHIEI